MSHIVSIKTEVRDAEAVKVCLQATRARRAVLREGDVLHAARRSTSAGASNCPAGIISPSRTSPLGRSTTTTTRFLGRPEAPRRLRPGLRRLQGDHRSEEAGSHGLRAAPRGRLDQAGHPGRGCRLKKTIEIVISPTGETKVETKGFSGGECRDASKFVEVALGQKTASSRPASSSRLSRSTATCGSPTDRQGPWSLDHGPHPRTFHFER